MKRDDQFFGMGVPMDIDHLTELSGCSELQVVSGLVCGLQKYKFTTAVVGGLGAKGHDRRYCDEFEADARTSLLNWDGRGHPSGPWIKCKGAGVDMLNPNLD